MDERRRSSARYRTQVPRLRDTSTPRPDRRVCHAASGRSTRSTTATSSAARSAASRSRPARSRSGVTSSFCPLRRPPSSVCPQGGRRSSVCPASPRRSASVSSGSSSTRRTRRIPSRIASSPSPRRRRSSWAHDARLLVDRQSRERGRCTCGRGRLERGALPGRPRAGEARRTAIFGAQSSPSTPATTTAAAHASSCRSSRLGVRERAAPLVLRRGLEDARLRDRRAARLDAPRRGDRPIASGSMFTKVHQAFSELRDLGLVDSGRPRLSAGRRKDARPSRGIRGRREAEARPPEHDGTVARDREPCRRRARRRNGACVARRLYAVARTRSLTTSRARRDDRRLRRDGAGRHARRVEGSLRVDELGESDRVVLLVTGDGLKTPGLVADRLAPTFVAPDADLILESLGVAIGGTA